jgi:siderophore synthetase component
VFYFYQFLCVLGCDLEPRCTTPQLLLSAIRRVFSSPCWSFPEQTIIKELNDPLALWDTFATAIDLDPATSSDISDELASSVRWQAYSYDHPPNAPTLFSPSIDWEQSIVEGHPTHPVRVPSVCTHKEVAHR